MHHLQAGDRHALVLRPRHQDPARDLGPPQFGDRTGGGVDPERAAVPGDNRPGSDQPRAQSGPHRGDRTGTSRRNRRSFSPQPQEPADQRRLGRPGDQRDRELSRQPAPGPRERSRRVAQPRRQALAAEVVEDVRRPGRETGGRAPRAQRQRPDEPGRGRDEQPPEPPPGDPAGQHERQREHERQLSEQEVGDQEQHRAGGDDPAAARRARRNRVAGTPRHRSHPWHSLAPPEQLSTLGCQECTLRVDTY